VYRPDVRLGLDLPRDVLDGRVDARVAGMWRDGLLDEVRALLDEGLRGSPTASRALGYAQAIEQLDGTMTEGEAQRSTADATKKLVRRQQRWFRRDPSITWLDAASPELLDRALHVVRAE
jgi:tRNA dimethylallyltransferase